MRCMQNNSSVKKICRVSIAIIASCMVHQHLYAQDPVFSQAYLEPINLNPAATGSGEHDFRVSGIYRRQWWTIPSQMNYMAFSIDKFLPSISSGIGLLVTNSSEGYLKKSGIYASYAYTICSGTLSPADNGELPRWFWSGACNLAWRNEGSITANLPLPTNWISMASSPGPFPLQMLLLIAVSCIRILRRECSLTIDSQTIADCLPVSAPIISTDLTNLLLLRQIPFAVIFR